MAALLVAEQLAVVVDYELNAIMILWVCMFFY